MTPSQCSVNLNFSSIFFTHTKGPVLKILSSFKPKIQYFHNHLKYQLVRWIYLDIYESVIKYSNNSI